MASSLGFAMQNLLVVDGAKSMVVIVKEYTIRVPAIRLKTTSISTENQFNVFNWIRL